MPATELPTPLESMTGNQRARRERVLDAVIELIGEGGVSDLSMRELADRSGVAIGTVYRYFSSKDHVVAAALVQWASRLEQAVGRRRLTSGPPAERLRAVLRQGVRPFAKEPEFARLMVEAATSRDAHAARCYRQLGDEVSHVLRQALEGLPDEQAEAVLSVVGCVWFTALVELVNGRTDVAGVYRRLDQACDVTLGPLSGVVAGRLAEI